MHTHTHTLASVLLLLLCLAAPSVGSAQTGDAESQARGFIQEAVREHQAGRYPEAQALFRRAHALDPTARTLRGIGMASFEMREYVTALRALRAALAEQERRPLTDAQREHAQRLVDRALAFVGTYRVELDPAEATMHLDGRSLEPEPDGTVLIDAGTHTLSIEAPGHRIRSVRLVVDGGAESTLTLRLESLSASEPVNAEPEPEPERDLTTPTPPPASPPAISRGGGGGDGEGLIIGGTILVVAAGLAGGASVGTGILALSKQADLQDECRGTVCSGSLMDTQAQARTLALATDVLWIGAAALAVTGAVLLILGVSQGSAEDPAVQAACGPDGCGFGVEGHF